MKEIEQFKILCKDKPTKTFSTSSTITIIPFTYEKVET